MTAVPMAINRAVEILGKRLDTFSLCFQKYYASSFQEAIHTTHQIVQWLSGAVQMARIVHPPHPCPFSRHLDHTYGRQPVPYPPEVGEVSAQRRRQHRKDHE